ncbi:hypothetical protein PHYSODRAFT_296663 [Phytophthora sojae]|uniref:Uncharacterized protein n=1 Tax=Phytophthora sojae (strain P6497) TaxID=1094619 RepID=G4Z099_PHYSP|nr:hypothetical protein PHYSODRAFT_296663 [Phytophthora sojae]EGZ24656.1 hypothetical protein PHYSODRAFT_296663 [Phytophthora sojae]|eukprot:XP_009519944.1 hypothetical protein PHYSODRAFT_296663 [Phytophthora sojae]
MCERSRRSLEGRMAEISTSCNRKTYHKDIPPLAVTMECDAFRMERMLNFTGASEGMRFGFIKCRLDKAFALELQSEDEYFNALISLSEYSFGAFKKDASNPIPGTDMNKSDGSFNNLFHYDYSNNVDYTFIYDCLANPLIRTPVYQQYCGKHRDELNGMSGALPSGHTQPHPADENAAQRFVQHLLRGRSSRDLYAFIAYVVNQFRDGSSFKSFITDFGKKRARQLLKTMNRSFRRIDFKFVLKKYMPLLYTVYAYCADARVDCLDRVYDYMLNEGLSVFKTVPSKQVVVGYKVNDQYRIDVLETSAVLDFVGDRQFQIASHTLLESLNFGFHDARLKAYQDISSMDRRIGGQLRKMYASFSFNGRSVFSGEIICSEDAIVVGC